MLMPARASGLANDRSIPVSAKSRGPQTFRQRHPLSAETPSGIEAVAQTTDSSSGVLVMEKKGELIAQAGISAMLLRRQTPNSWERTDNVTMDLPVAFAWSGVEASAGAFIGIFLSDRPGVCKHGYVESKPQSGHPE